MGVCGSTLGEDDPNTPSLPPVLPSSHRRGFNGTQCTITIGSGKGKNGSHSTHASWSSNGLKNRFASHSRLSLNHARWTQQYQYPSSGGYCSSGSHNNSSAGVSVNALWMEAGVNEVHGVQGPMGELFFPAPSTQPSSNPNLTRSHSSSVTITTPSGAHAIPQLYAQPCVIGNGRVGSSGSSVSGIGVDPHGTTGRATSDPSALSKSTDSGTGSGSGLYPQPTTLHTVTVAPSTPILVRRTSIDYSANSQSSLNWNHPYYFPQHQNQHHQQQHRISEPPDCTENEYYWSDDNPDYQNYVRRWEANRESEQRQSELSQLNGRSLFHGLQIEQQRQKILAVAPNSGLLLTTTTSVAGSPMLNSLEETILDIDFPASPRGVLTSSAQANSNTAPTTRCQSPISVDHQRNETALTDALRAVGFKAVTASPSSSPSSMSSSAASSPLSSSSPSPVFLIPHVAQRSLLDFIREISPPPSAPYRLTPCHSMSHPLQRSPSSIATRTVSTPSPSMKCQPGTHENGTSNYVLNPRSVPVTDSPTSLPKPFPSHPPHPRSSQRSSIKVSTSSSVRFSHHRHYSFSNDTAHI